MDPTSIFAAISFWILSSKVEQQAKQIHELEVQIVMQEQSFIDLATTHSAFAARSETVDQQHDRRIEAVNQRVDNILEYIVDNPSAASDMIEENNNENLQD